MSYTQVFALAVGLSMDATAVAAARGLHTERIEAKHVAKVAVFFGGAQAAMPLFGYVLGAELGPFMNRYAHWVAFVLLAGIGAKMLWEARATNEDENESEQGVKRDPWGHRVMFGLAVATSIDAFAAGITLPLLGAPLVFSLVAIGVTTAVLSALGLVLGRRLGALLGKRLEVVGGLVLLLLAVKVLVDHYRT
jgi:putative Mn2+ efflux pump MntP